MREKTQILLTEEFQILYVCVYVFIGIHFPYVEIELHLPPPLSLDFLIHFQRNEGGKEKINTFTVKKIWQILPVTVRIMAPQKCPLPNTQNQ